MIQPKTRIHSSQGLLRKGRNRAPEFRKPETNYILVFPGKRGRSYSFVNLGSPGDERHEAPL